MKIYLVRHTSVNVPVGTCYGHTDVGLNNSFEEEASVVKNNLTVIKPDIVFSSPLSRCSRLTRYCGFENPIFDDRLKEMNFGKWENRLWDDLDMSIWEKDWVNPPVPDGESFQQMYERVASFFDELRNKSYNSAIIFTHGGVISCSRVYFEEADIQETFDLMPAYGDIVEFNL